MAAEAATAAAEAPETAWHGDLRRPGRCHAAGDGTAAASNRGGDGGVAAAEMAAAAAAAEAAAAAWRGDLPRPGTACCRAAGDRTAAAVVVPLLPRFCRIYRRRGRAAAVTADAGVVLR